ncbi:DUF3631 domain-containing protein [Sphingomonas beigongshangi]|uniref:DUF3631 domain-containing protein n=1 Tax=Sphingomonas beigongshangi TaxID=2782540 RepID=UPI001AEE2712|nr:DUF3631 domain-containing protein [Sphingomonas beigongshangi]
MAYLGSVGIDASVCASLELGIKEPYVRADGTRVDGVLVYPIDVADGRRRYGCLNLPGVTISPENPVAWSPGAPRAVLRGERGALIVTCSPLDVFRIRASAERRDLAVAATASSRSGAFPVDWNDTTFWGRWSRVIVAQELPAEMRARIARIARRPIQTTMTNRPERYGSGMDASDDSNRWLDDMLDASLPTEDRAVANPIAGEAGDFAAEPMPVHGGFCNGRLFYPFRVERRRAMDGGGRGPRMVHSYETLVVRSDGAVLEASTLPSPPGTPSSQRVHALTDGTRVAALPTPSRNPTWSLDAINAFVAARATGTDPCVRQPYEILDDVHRMIGSKVSLPVTDDMWVAAIFVVVTHMFRIFNALPILLVQGDHGTGKSELAAAVANLSFNAVTMGQGSAAALVRLMRECGGLIVLDDAEVLGAGFGDLAQCLKTGYRASTARKPITLPGGRVETFDFFGPRLVTCTRSLEPILASRCVRIASACGVPAMRLPENDSAALRDELHVLAMARAAEVARAYAEMTMAMCDRKAEIWTPLLAVVETLGSEAAQDALRRARSRHSSLV